MNKTRAVIENPNYLDTEKANITLLSDEEVFIEIPYLKEGYYISLSGRMYSQKRERLLNYQLYGPIGNKYPCYRLPDRDGIYKNYRVNRLVAEFFLKAPVIDREKLSEYDVHHLDCNRLNNHVSNLQYLSREEHRAINFKLYLYNLGTGNFKQFKSLSRLCNYTRIDRRYFHRDIYYRSPDFTFFNGLDGYLINGAEYDGLPVFVGIERLKGNESYKTIKLEVKQQKTKKLLEAM